MAITNVNSDHRLNPDGLLYNTNRMETNNLFSTRGYFYWH